MSEFLFVIPAGWTEIDWSIAGASTNLAVAAVEEWCATGNMAVIDEELKVLGLIAPDATVVEAKLFNGEKFVIRLG
jgi:hypothetical protein